MVFVKLYLVCGIQLDRETVLNKFEDEIEFITDDIMPSHTQINDLVLLGFPCCSELNSEQFIFGTIVSTYYRRYTTCNNDTRSQDGHVLSVCDECIKMTDNGAYDVDKILNTVVECPKDQVCPICYHDNKEIVDVCKRCNQTIEQWNFQDYYLRKEMSEYDLDTYPIKYYYMLNDCLSCT